MQLMNRIYIQGGDFLNMSPDQQTKLIEATQATRLSALSASQTKAKKITKSALKNIAKRKGTAKSKKMLKDPTAAAMKALAKLTPEQIALIAASIPKD